MTPAACRAVVLAVALAGLPVFGQGQSAKQPPQKQPAPKQKAGDIPNFSTAAFDPTVESLPARFPGHSCRAIAKALKASNPAKGEFETSDAYSKRLEGIKTTALFGGVAANDIFSFVRPVLSQDIKYEADSQTMYVYYLLPINLASRRSAADLVDVSLPKRTTYTGENAYGKKVSVEKAVYDVCALSLKNIEYEPRRTSANDGFKISPEEARLTKENLALLYVGKLAEPYYVQYGNISKPTIDAPTDVLWNGDSVVIEVLSVWAIDKSTGRVLKKDFRVR